MNNRRSPGIFCTLSRLPGSEGEAEWLLSLWTPNIRENIMTNPCGTRKESEYGCLVAELTLITDMRLCLIMSPDGSWQGGEGHMTASLSVVPAAGKMRVWLLSAVTDCCRRSPSKWCRNMKWTQSPVWIRTNSASVNVKQNILIFTNPQRDFSAYELKWIWWFLRRLETFSTAFITAVFSG